MTTHAHLPSADRPATTTIKVYELDPAAPLDPGRNPIPIAEMSIPFEQRVPRRERRAKEHVEKRLGRMATITHAEGGVVIATVQIERAGAARPKAPTQTLEAAVQQAVERAFRDPKLLRAVTDEARANLTPLKDPKALALLRQSQRRG